MRLLNLEVFDFPLSAKADNSISFSVVDELKEEIYADGYKQGYCECLNEHNARDDDMLRGAILSISEAKISYSTIQSSFLAEMEDFFVLLMNKFLPFFAQKTFPALVVDCLLKSIREGFDGIVCLRVSPIIINDVNYFLEKFGVDGVNVLSDSGLPEGVSYCVSSLGSEHLIDVKSLVSEVNFIVEDYFRGLRFGDGDEAAS